MSVSTADMRILVSGPLTIEREEAYWAPSKVGAEEVQEKPRRCRPETKAVLRHDGAQSHRRDSTGHTWDSCHVNIRTVMGYNSGISGDSVSLM